MKNGLAPVVASVGAIVAFLVLGIFLAFVLHLGAPSHAPRPSATLSSPR